MVRDAVGDGAAVLESEPPHPAITAVTATASQPTVQRVVRDVMLRPPSSPGGSGQFLVNNYCLLVNLFVFG